MLKKLYLIVSLFVFMTSVSFAISRDEQYEQEEEKEMEFFYDLRHAKNYYCEGNFLKAEEIIDKVLELSIDNEKANELRNKILLLKEKEDYYKKIVLNDYLIELKRAIKDGNCYEGFLFVKKIKEIAPNENIDSFCERLENNKRLILFSMDSLSDRSTFEKSIEAFVNEEFNKSAKYVHKLYQKYPKFVEYLGIIRCYLLKDKSSVRAENFYKKSVKYFKKMELGKAIDYAQISYSMKPESIKIKLLIDQINMEII